jgi:hypothetical protein
METESEGQLPFLDFDIYRRPEGSLGHKVYRKPTHTNLFLNAESHHHPSNKQAVLSTLIHRTRALCNENRLQAELVFLTDVFKEDGYKDRKIHRALNCRAHLPQPDNEPHSIAFLPFVGIVFNRINRVLARHNIKSVGLPHMKLSILLRLVNNHLGLRTPGVYRIPRECGRFYIRQTGRPVDIRLKEHQRHIRLQNPDKSAVAEHSIDQGYRIKFHNSSILAKKTRYMDRIVRETIEIELHPYNINNEGGFCLSKSLNTLIGSLNPSGHDPRTLGDAVPHS